MSARPREVLLEYFEIDGQVRASAIDPETGVEVTVTGPISAGEPAIRRTAIAKLDYVLSRRARDEERERQAAEQRRKAARPGIIV